MAKGRPSIEPSERLVSISIRVPSYLHAFYKKRGHMSANMRKALEEYALRKNDI